VTIYVPYDGVVKELMYEVDDVATKGEPLMTIEVEGDMEAEGTLCLLSLSINIVNSTD
jgi:pyruvate/2-oxoglutarate dehydrogenase complex dihydrolipoamide acyltransferase (E2) component